MSIYQIGRLGKCYVKVESTYGTAPTFAATDAFRHIDVNTSASLNRSPSLEKRGTPGLRDRFSRHITGLLDIKNAYLQPSGTIGTKPEANVLLKNAFGVETVGTGNTTVASGPTTTGATVTSAVGFAIGQMISIIELGGATPGTYNRMLTNVVGSALTWAPALPTAPAASDTVKSGVTYSFANDLPSGFTFAHYLPNVSVEMHGCVVDKLTMMFDGNGEMTFSVSAPAKERLRPAQTIPGSFTTVGSPITGIVGSFLLNGTAYQVVKGSIAITNAEAMQNEIYGTDRSQGFYRNGRRAVALAITAKVTDDITLATAAEAASDNALFLQCNNVEGKVISLYMPRTEFDVAQTPDADGSMDYSFTGVAKETLTGIGGSATAGNDECFLGFC